MTDDASDDDGGDATDDTTDDASDDDGGDATDDTTDDASDDGGTTRERIAAALRESAQSASDLSRTVGVPESSVYDHLRHVARSTASTDEQFLVAPPRCRTCGFDGFDDPLGAPSRCPECRSERIADAEFKIERE